MRVSLERLVVVPDGERRGVPRDLPFTFGHPSFIIPHSSFINRHPSSANLHPLFVTPCSSFHMRHPVSEVEAFRPSPPALGVGNPA